MVRDLMELIKSRILFAALLSTMVGYFLAESVTEWDFLFLFWVCLGVGLIFSASAAINHVLETDVDGLMERTKDRPMVKKRVPEIVVWAGVFLSLCLGSLILFVKVNVIVLMLAWGTLVLYDFIYTPLKRVTILNTWIGAFPGAMPVLCGWFSVTQYPSVLMVLIFSVYYWWQLPHFFAISWINRASYKNADLKMVSADDVSGSRTILYLVSSLVVFLGFSLSPFFLGYLGRMYVLMMMVLNIVLCWTVLLFCKEVCEKHARYILFASILYPPLILVAVVLDFLL